MVRSFALGVLVCGHGCGGPLSHPGRDEHCGDGRALFAALGCRDFSSPQHRTVPTAQDNMHLGVFDCDLRRAQNSQGSSSVQPVQFRSDGVSAWAGRARRQHCDRPRPQQGSYWCPHAQELSPISSQRRRRRSPRPRRAGRPCRRNCVGRASQRKGPCRWRSAGAH